MTSPTTSTWACDRSGRCIFIRSRAPDRVILQPRLPDRRRVVEVAAVENQGLLQALLDRAEIGAAKLFPLGDDDQSVRAIHGGERGVCITHPRLIPEHQPAFPYGRRFVSRKPG